MYEYGIVYHDKSGNSRLTIECEYPIDETSMDPKRIGRSKGTVTAHVRAENTRAALDEFWKMYDETNAAHI